MSQPVGPQWAEHPELVSYFSSSRRNPEDLYPSERRFLPWLAASSRSVLDAGCGAGGFYGIWKHFNPSIEYTGTDFSSALISAARGIYPGVRFEVAHCAEGTALPDGFSDTVAALGWLHWEPRYTRAIGELWRLAGRFLFFDVRLVVSEAEERTGRQKLVYGGAWDGVSATPYITVAWFRFAELMLSLNPKRILGCGYFGPPSSTVEGVLDPVLFSTFVLEKPDETQTPPTVCLEMPLPFPERFADQVRLLEPGQLSGQLSGL